MVEISNSEEFKRWLEQRHNRDEAVCLAARAALRVVPFAVADLRSRPEKSPEELILPLIRANAISWLAALVPTHEIAAAARAALAAAATFAATFAAALAARAAFAATRAADADANAATFAAALAARADADADAYFWSALSADATALESGLAPAELARHPLWPEAAPAQSSMLENWQEMRDILFRREGEDWAVWTDWYQARLDGAPVNESLEIARLFQDDLSIWDKGPKTVNAAIRQLIEEHTQIPLKRPSQRDKLLANPPGRPTERNQLVDIEGHEPSDNAQNSEDRQLGRMPRLLKAASDSLIAALGDNQKSAIAAFENYRKEISLPQNEVILELLKQAHEIARAGILAEKKQELLDESAKEAWRVFNENHILYLSHFPFDPPREEIYRDTQIVEGADPNDMAIAFLNFLKGIGEENVEKYVGPQLELWAESSAAFAQLILDKSRNFDPGDISPEDMPHREWFARQAAQGWSMAVALREYCETDNGKTIKNAGEVAAIAAALATALGSMII